MAAGASTRMGFDKLAWLINGESVLCKSVKAFDSHPIIDDIVIVCKENDINAQNAANACNKKATLVNGGALRFNSVENGVRAASGNIVAIHDAARPFVSHKIITNTVEKAVEYGAAAPAVSTKDTVKQATNGKVSKTLPRDELYAIQTPQVFKKALYLNALASVELTDDITDDCMILERFGADVYLVNGEYENYKITTKDDLKEQNKMRIGHGYDVHKLVENRPLILGGVLIPHEKGLLGHSDADVLVHAIMDALLGAAALGDIGLHFPDTAVEYKGANSIELLKKVYGKTKEMGYKIGNIDATILCQAPKLRPYIDAMIENLAIALNAENGVVNVKATTEEGLGFTGAKEGIAAHAVVLLV